jgi:hypothetical protein
LLFILSGAVLFQNKRIDESYQNRNLRRDIRARTPVPGTVLLLARDPDECGITKHLSGHMAAFCFL